MYVNPPLNKDISLPATYAAAPVVDTTISVYADGTAPFDATTFNENGNNENAGTDADVPWWVNDMVRLNDFITYRVEVSLNDAADENLTSVITLDEGEVALQKFEEIPADCKTENENGEIYSPLSSISADGKVLTCNLWHHREWTNLSFLANARATVLGENGGNVEASVSSYTTQTQLTPAVSGPVDTNTTASFWVDIRKSIPRIPIYDASWAETWKKYDPTVLDVVDPSWNSSDIWNLIDFDINVVYKQWSTMVEHDWLYFTDRDFIDTFTNNWIENDSQLYDCSFQFPNSATIWTCTQLSQDPLQIWINVNSIDVRESELFSLRMRIRVPDQDVSDSWNTDSSGNPSLNLINSIYFAWSNWVADCLEQPVSNDSTSVNNFDCVSLGNWWD